MRQNSSISLQSVDKLLNKFEISFWCGLIKLKPRLRIQTNASHKETEDMYEQYGLWPSGGVI